MRDAAGRLRALRPVASGIVHDINNALSPIALQPEALLESEPTSAAVRESLQTIHARWKASPQTVARMRNSTPARAESAHLPSSSPPCAAVIDLTHARWTACRGARPFITVRTDLAADLPAVRRRERDPRGLVNLI